MLSSLVLATLLSSGLSAPTPDAARTELITEQMRATNGDHVKALAAEADRTPAHVVAAAADDRGFLGTYFPFSLDEEMHPEVEENVILIWLMTVFFGEYAGPVWIPKAFLDADLGPDYMSEALINWLVHMGMLVCSVPFLYFFLLGIIPILANTLYLFPVATINSINHHALENDGGGGRQKKRKRRRNSLNELPGMNRAAVAAY